MGKEATLPEIKPGKENAKFLTKEEHALIKEHFALKRATEQTLVANKERHELIKAKITNFQLSQRIMQEDINKVSQEQLVLEKQLDQLGLDYEQGVKKDIRNRLKIPPDKPFSFDPVTLEVTMGG
jgi:hypothetical protein